MGALIGSRRLGAPAKALRTRMSLAASTKFGSIIAGATLNAPLAYSTLIVRSKYILTQEMAQLRVEPHNWLYPADTGNANFTITGMYLEGGGGGIVGLTQVLWSGGASTTVNAQTVCRNPSDIILPSSMGLGTFPAGGIVWLRIAISVSIGSNFPGSATGFATGEAAYQYNNATTAYSPLNSSGVVSLVSGTDHAGMTGTYYPMLVGLRNSASTPPAILLVGDSELDNDGDSTYGANSYVTRACRALATPAACLTITHGGRSQANLVTDTEWLRAMKYVSVLIDGHGTNAPTDFTSQLTYYVAARTAGLQRVFHIGLYPQSLSSDSYATLANQTFNSGDTQATAFNAWIATKVNDGTASQIDGQWSPTSASIRDATNSHAWKSNGTANAYTSDGLHMNPNGAGAPITACATEFGTQLTTWLSGLTEPAQ